MTLAPDVIERVQRKVASTRQLCSMFQRPTDTRGLPPIKTDNRDALMPCPFCGPAASDRIAKPLGTWGYTCCGRAAIIYEEWKVWAD